MSQKIKHKLALDRPETYEIKVPVQLDGSISEWVDDLTMSIEYSEAYSSTVTTLTCRVDQAGLQGLLRQLYSFGLPLLSVLCTTDEMNENNSYSHVC